MIPLSVSEISALAGFCDEKQDEEHEQELDNPQKLKVPSIDHNTRKLILSTNEVDKNFSSSKLGHAVG